MRFIRKKKIPQKNYVVHASLKHKIIKVVHSYKRMVWDYKRGDYDAFMQLLLHAPWYSCYNSNNINVVVGNFMNMFTSIADTCIPHYEATIRPNDKNFMNSDIRHKMNVCDRYWKQYQQTNLDEHHDKFKEMQNKVVYAIRKSKNNIEKKKNDLVSKTEVGSKLWWSLYKSILNGGISLTLGPLKDGDIIVTNDLEKANLLNNSFISQTIFDDKNVLLPDLPPYCNHLINQKVISAIDVYKVLNGLDISKATGPDNISNKLLKKDSVPISEPLSHLFNSSLSLGTFPDAWKLANVIAILKKGDTSFTLTITPSLSNVVYLKFLKR